MTAEPRRRSSWAVWIAGALVLLPLLYVAGIGPLGAAFEYDRLDGGFWLLYARPAQAVLRCLPRPAAEWVNAGLSDYIVWCMDWM